MGESIISTKHLGTPLSLFCYMKLAGRCKNTMQETLENTVVHVMMG